MPSAFYENWPEIIATIVLVLGFIVALTLTSAFITYIVVFLTAMLLGRLWFRNKKDLKFPFFLIFMALLLGLLLGSRYGSKRVITILFILGMSLSYYLHDKGLIKSI